jgi:hypothetical protein
MRQEIAVSSTDMYVSYTIVFPLVGEGVILVVQGKKDREKEVVKVFDNCIRQFVNMKPYSAVSAIGVGEETHSIFQVAANVFFPVVTGAIVIFWIMKVRKARSKAV